jgi:fibronectin type III domain protein
MTSGDFDSLLTLCRYTVFVDSVDVSGAMSGAVTEYTVTGLDADTDYTVRVDITNVAGNTAGTASVLSPPAA